MKTPAEANAAMMPTRATTMIHFIPRLSHRPVDAVRCAGGIPLRALTTLAAVVAVGVTARLGWWQLDRAQQKDARLASVEAQALLPPIESAELLAVPVDSKAQAALHHRVAVLQGRWRAEHLLFLENRPMNGRPGFIALTPLELSDGRAILVQRGWQPRDLRDRTLTQPVPSPIDQPVQVRGRLAPAPSRLMDFDGAALGPVRQNVELEGLAAETGLDLLPVTLVQLESALICGASEVPPKGGPAPDVGGGVASERARDVARDLAPDLARDQARDLTHGLAPRCDTPLEDGLLRDWPVVASSSDKNRGYAVQWFSLSALVLALYFWFQIIQPWRQARKAP